MYHVLIADDEAIERNALKILLENNISEIKVTGEAENGVQLLQMLRKNKYDIAFVDIEMSGISGIEAVEMAGDEIEGTQVIMFTAYSDFEYVQASIKNHVFDYLLKPTKRDKLLLTVRNCIGKIEKERKVQSDNEKMKQLFQQIQPLVEEEIMTELCSKNSDTERLFLYMDALNLHAQNGYIAVFQIYGKNNEKISIQNTFQFLSTKKEIMDQLCSVIREFVESAVVSKRQDRLVMFVPVEVEKNEYQNRIDAVNLVHIILGKIHLENSIRLKAGIGNVRKVPEDICISYQEGIYALQDGRSNIAIRHYNDVFGVKSEIYLNKEKIQLHKDIKEENEKNMNKTIDNIFFKLNQKTTEDSAALILDMLLSIIREEESYLGEEQEKGFYLSKICRECMGCEDKEQLKQWVLDQCNGICHKIHENNNFNQIVDRAKQYINDHFQEELSLNEISEHCNVSIYYMSRMFKETTGENYSVYLNRVRVKEAQKMIRKFDYPIKTLAERCGFNSEGYFCRIFKQYTGKTVKEYKEAL